MTRFGFVGTFLSLFLTAHASAAPTLTTLVDFTGSAGAAKGSGPRGALVFHDGLLWGTTELTSPTNPQGNGTIYSFDPDTSTFTNLEEFAGTTTGSKPVAGLLLASDGNFYGATSSGGSADNKGSIFQMLPDGTLNTLYVFRTATESSVGSAPAEQLVEGADGFLYGTASAGGLNGKGTIFKVSKTVPSTPITLVEFAGGMGGANRGSKPSALVGGKDGNFYGVTEAEGALASGTAFKMTPAGVITTLGDFGGGTAPAIKPKTPRAPMIQARDGNFYGTTALGGKNTFGAIYKMTPGGVATALINFTGTSGAAMGSLCEAPLVQGTDGKLYGVTRKGGTSDRGTIFRLTTAGTGFETLIEFTGNGANNQGSDPRGGLVQDNDGNFYGTTSGSGANGAGLLFKLSDVLPPKPIVSTQAPTNIKGTSATLSGLVNTQGTAGGYWFEYGTTAAYGSKAPLTPGALTASNAAVTKTATVTGLQPGTEYHYRIVASNGGGFTEGGDLSFTTGPHPTILDQPDDLLVGIGDAAAFTVQSSGTTAGTPVTYAWLKNGAGNALGTQATYTITKTALTHAGSYAARVTKAPDTVLSNSAKLGVISVANTQLNAFQDATVTLNLPNAAPGGALSFQWKKNNVDVINDSRISGATTAKLVIEEATDADNGVYTCLVTMGSLTKLSGQFTVAVLMRPVMNAVTLGPWTTNGFVLPGQQVSATNSPVGFEASGLPAGVVLNKTTGALSGRPINDGNYNVIFTAKNAAGASAPLTVPVTVLAPAPLAVGTFNGLIARAAGNTELGGSVNLTIASTGAVTGKIIHAGRSYSFTSKLSDAPDAIRTITPTSITGTPAIGATFSLTEATGEMAGFISGASVAAKRQAPQPALSPTLGRYNLAFSTKVADSTNAALPQGGGFGTLTVGATGAATWVCRLGDNNGGSGVAFTVVSSIASDGAVPLHKSLYAVATGSAQGWLSISGAQVITEQSFDWLKLAQPASSTTRSYKNGFALHALEADGAKYVKPAANVHVLGLSGSTNNAEIKFTMGGLPATITQVFSFPDTNVPSIPANANSITLKLDLNLGTFSGTVTELAGPRKVNYLGVLLPHVNQGIGQFQMPELPNPATSPLVSGRVVIGAP